MSKQSRIEEDEALQNAYREAIAALKEAWIFGSDHRLPTFDQLNHWREVIAKAQQ